jgi:hypothetical protein
MFNFSAGCFLIGLRPAADDANISFLIFNSLFTQNRPFKAKFEVNTWNKLERPSGPSALGLRLRVAACTFIFRPS